MEMSISNQCPSSLELGRLVSRANSVTHFKLFCKLFEQVPRINLQRLCALLMTIPFLWREILDSIEVDCEIEQFAILLISS